LAVLLLRIRIKNVWSAVSWQWAFPYLRLSTLPAAVWLQELTLAMLEEMDSDVEIPALTEINEDVQLPPAGTTAAADAAAASDEQPPAKKRKQSEGQAAAAGDAEMAAAEEQAAVAADAEPEVEQYDTGERHARTGHHWSNTGFTCHCRCTYYWTYQHHMTLGYIEDYFSDHWF
jgi:hypothetical protein